MVAEDITQGCFVKRFFPVWPLAALSMAALPVTALSQQTDFIANPEAYADGLVGAAPRRGEIPNAFTVAAPDVVELGWGWSEQRVEPIPTSCIEFETRKGPAQTSTITIQEVSDSYTLSKALDVSASTSIRAFGAKVDGKASMSKNSQVSSMSVTYVVRAEVLNASTYVGPGGTEPVAARSDVPVPDAVTAAAEQADTDATQPRALVGPAVRLTREAVSLAQRSEDDFRRICGGGYVSSAVTGARAYLVSVVKTKSKSQREAVKASVSGSGWGQKVSAAAKGTSEESQDSFQRDLTFFQEGGSATATPVSVGEGEDAEVSSSDLPKDADEAIARITKLATAARDAAKVFEISISPYEALENYPTRSERDTDTPEHETLAALMGSYTTLYDDLAEALANPSTYQVPLRTCSDTGCSVSLEPLTNDLAFQQVEDAQDISLAALTQLDQMAQECFAEGNACEIDFETVRSPYSVYNNAPMPIVAEDTASIADHTSVFMRDTAASRCAIGVATAGCITNAMIRAWGLRKGMKSFEVPNPKDSAVSVGSCEDLSDKTVYPGDANDADRGVIWANPSLTFGVDGKVVCT